MECSCFTWIAPRKSCSKSEFEINIHVNNLKAKNILVEFSLKLQVPLELNPIIFAFYLGIGAKEHPGKGSPL